jgi:hypothetical protein
MGYTHYWNHEELDTGKWEREFVPVARNIIVHEIDLLCIEFDEEDVDPFLGPEALKLNGKGEQGHETFMLTVSEDKFGFCKTARKPYDKAVVALLMLARHVFGDAFEWSSDGQPADHKEGFSLLRQFATETDIAQCRADNE